MAALSTVSPTLLDFARRLDPDDSIAQIIEILNETNEIIGSAVALEGNLPTGHRTTIRTGLPTPTWRKLYGGVQPTKSTTVQVTDNCGMLEAYAEVDKALADLNGNTAAFRLSENLPHIEGMNQEFASTLFNGNEGTEPEAFTGFGPRFNLLTGAENSDNVLDGGSNDTDNTSIYLVCWGPNSVHLIYPKASKAGLSMEDKGQVTVEDASGGSNTGRMEAYRTHYRWDCGLSVRDWRYVVRIANIEVSDLVKTGATGADLIDLMTQALELVPSLSVGKPVFYCNRTIKSFLRRQIMNKVASSTLTMDQVAGKHVMSFDGVPVERCDAILNDETALA